MFDPAESFCNVDGLLHGYCMRHQHHRVHMLLPEVCFLLLKVEQEKKKSASPIPSTIHNLPRGNPVFPLLFVLIQE